LAVGVANGALLAVGGYDYASALSTEPRVLATVEAYDPVANTWSARTPMPTARYYPAVGTINGMLHVAGGAGPEPGGVALAVVDAYDPSTNSWTSRASVPVAGVWSSSGVLGNRLYVIGGSMVGDVPGSLKAYDPATNSWETGPSLPKGSAASAVVNGILYAVVNGYTFAGPGDPCLGCWDY
jgi:N-acetylneuraminic acid mutarotase